MFPIPRRGHLFAATLVVVGSCVASARAQCEPVETAKIFPADAMRRAGFGRGVAIDGDLAVVGAWNDGNTSPKGGIFTDGPGAAYIYRRTSPNVWVEVAKLKVAHDAARAFGDWLGYSVAISGDVVVLGAIHVNTPFYNTGAAYVFRFDGREWVQEAKLMASDRWPNDRFGYSVGISGDVVVVGAPQNDLTAVGKAYVFRRSGGEWLEQARLIPPDLVENDELGSAVAVSGDVAIIGAWNHGNRGSVPDGTGAAYVYRFDSRTGSWDLEQKLVSTETFPGDRDRFGFSVTLQGDVALIGTSPARLNGSLGHSGCYVFRFDQNSWIADPKIVPPKTFHVVSFGGAVALRGNALLIGAPFDWPSGKRCPFPQNCHTGSAFLYRDSAAGWEFAAKLVASDNTQADQFGEYLALGDGFAFIGARRVNVVGIDSGAAYIYDLSSCLPSPGDLNCDGRLDGADIDPFFLALGDPAAYLLQFPTCDPLNGDMNGDGRLDGGDIDPFFACLGGGQCP